MQSSSSIHGFNDLSYTWIPWVRQSQGPSWGWRTSGDLTSAITGIGVKLRPRGLMVAGEVRSDSWQGVLDSSGLLKGLEGGCGRTREKCNCNLQSCILSLSLPNTALGCDTPWGGWWLLKLLKFEGLLEPPPALPLPLLEPQVLEPEPDTEPESAEEVDMAEER